MIKDKSIFIKNIYYMLSYAFQNLNQGEYKEIAKESFDNICDLFAAILEKGIGKQLKQGLYREYINKTENIATLRGKINFPESIKNRISRKQMLTCEYDELSENNTFNQILKTVMILLLGEKRVSSKRKANLKKIILFFSDIDTLEPNHINWNAIHFQKSNYSYRMLISICRLLIEGMLMTTEKGEHKLADFVDDQHMERLYEKFILEYYRKEHPELKANASQISWALDSGEDTMLPTMQSDITLTRGEKTLIIDAKYYTHVTQEQYGTHTYHSNNMYQIFTYVKNREAGFKNKAHKPVSGMLLYAKTDEGIQPDNSYEMSGNIISIKTLDLNRDFKDISVQLDSIATSFCG